MNEQNTELFAFPFNWELFEKVMILILNLTSIIYETEWTLRNKNQTILTQKEQRMARIRRAQFCRTYCEKNPAKKLSRKAC